MFDVNIFTFCQNLVTYICSGFFNLYDTFFNISINSAIDDFPVNLEFLNPLVDWLGIGNSPIIFVLFGGGLGIVLIYNLIKWIVGIAT